MIRRTRMTYWQHGAIAKFTAKFLGAPPRPGSATMEAWDKFDKNQKQNFPLQERIENTLNTLQNICMFPSDVYYTIRAYYRNRFVDQTHTLQTGLEPGQWYEFDTRLMNGMFNSFVYFIEKEQTLDNLRWEMTLVEKYEWMSPADAEKQPDYGKPCRQALQAIEKMRLYNWWKYERVHRPDPYEASGMKEYSEAQRKGGEENEWASIFSDNSECRHAISKKWHELEDQYYDEDTEMMIALVKLRRSIWT